MLCWDSGRRKLCKVPCHSFHIHGDWESKYVENGFKSSFEVEMQATIGVGSFGVIGVYEISTELRCIYSNFCTYTSLWYKHFYQNLRRIHLLQLKIHNIWIKFFWNQKNFHLSIKEISTLKYNKLFSIKLSSDIGDSSFLLDSLSKAKIFSNFSVGNSFLFLNWFWNVTYSDRCHFIVLPVCLLEKINTVIFKYFYFTT